MGDVFYKAVRFLGGPAFWVSSAPTVVDAERVPATGGCLIAATHESPYDIALLIRHTERAIDFVSIVEVFRNPVVGWLYGSLNAFPLDRSRPDGATVRIILDRLRRGRAVGIFPEGGFRPGLQSVVHTGRLRPGVGRLARLADVPVVPCVIINSHAYARPWSWAPLRRTRYGVIYGEPIDPLLDGAAIETRLVDAFVTLHGRLRAAMASADSAAPARRDRGRAGRGRDG